VNHGKNIAVFVLANYLLMYNLLPPTIFTFHILSSAVNETFNKDYHDVELEDTDGPSSESNNTAQTGKCSFCDEAREEYIASHFFISFVSVMKEFSFRTLFCKIAMSCREIFSPPPNLISSSF
jgi:hypothetical protein